MENKVANNRRILRFASVGVFNTIFDFGVLNGLVFLFDLNSIVANVVSGSLAAVISFLLNGRYVFGQRQQRSMIQFLKFFLITAFGIYGLQNLIIFLLTNYFTTPGLFFFELVDLFNPSTFSKDFVILNFAKAAATIASLSWNYVMYARFVFKPSDPKSS